MCAYTGNLKTLEHGCWEVCLTEHWNVKQDFPSINKDKCVCLCVSLFAPVLLSETQCLFNLKWFWQACCSEALFRCYKSVCRILVHIRWSQMRIDRPLSECSVLWQREWIKIHPAPGRRSLWQQLLWRLQGRVVVTVMALEGIHPLELLKNGTDDYVQKLQLKKMKIGEKMEECRGLNA